MPSPTKKRFALRSKRIRFLRSLKVYVWRAFYVLLLFCIGSTLLYINSTYFRSKILRKVADYSEKFGYVIKEIAVENENPSEYCIKLDEQNLLSKYKERSIVLFSTYDLREALEKVDCIDKVTIRKIFPSKIQLSVSCKTPAAIWQDGKTFYFITKAGEPMKIRNDTNLSKFILITGNNAPEHAVSLLKFTSMDKELYSKISTAIWIGDRRWNILFDNGTKLMLPEDRPKIAWTKFIQLQQSHAAFKDWKHKVVDLRIADKIYAK